MKVPILTFLPPVLWNITTRPPPSPTATWSPFLSKSIAVITSTATKKYDKKEHHDYSKLTSRPKKVQYGSYGREAKLLSWMSSPGNWSPKTWENFQSKAAGEEDESEFKLKLMAGEIGTQNVIVQAAGFAAIQFTLCVCESGCVCEETGRRERVVGG